MAGYIPSSLGKSILPRDMLKEVLCRGYSSCEKQWCPPAPKANKEWMLNVHIERCPIPIASLPIIKYLLLLNLETDASKSLLAIKIYRIQFKQAKYGSVITYKSTHIKFVTIKRFRSPSSLSTREKSPLIYASASPKSACVAICKECKCHSIGDDNMTTT